MGLKRKYNKLTPPDPSEQQWLTNHAAASSLAYKDHVYSMYTDKVQLDRQWRHHRTINSNLGVKCNIYVNERTGGVMVAYRGTSSIKEAKIDLTVGKEKFFNSKGVQQGEIYRGFSNAFNEILPVLKNELQFLYDTTYMRKGPLEVTGHSLGGALSDLTSTYFGDYFQDVKVVNTTFASPSVGDDNYIHYAQQPNVFRTRVVCLGDPISNVKIPGTDFTEKNNVIELIKERKGWKTTVLNLTKALGGVVPALGIGAYEAKQSHSLDTIIDELEDSLKSTRYQTQIVENVRLNDEVDDYNDQFKKSQEQATFDNNVDLGDKPCQCECHQVDQSTLENKGTPEQQATQRVKDLLGSQTVFGNGETAVASNKYGEVLDQTEAERRLLSELNELNANKLPEDIIQSIETTLNNDLEKQKDTLTKLTDQYQALLRPVQKEDQDLYSFTKDVEKDKREDIEDIDRQLEFELEHPEDIGEDNPAFKLKEEFNQLYKNIQSAAGSIDEVKNSLTGLNNQYVLKQAGLYKNKTDEEKQRLVNIDQEEQRDLSVAGGTLNDTIQGSGDVVLNYALINPSIDENQEDIRQLNTSEKHTLNQALSKYNLSIDDIKNNPPPATKLAEIIESLSDDARLLFDRQDVPEKLSKAFFSKTQQQLREWLNYPDMTPQKLFDLLKKQKIALYKQDRRVDLIKKDRDLKTKAAQELNQKISKLSQDELVTDETTGQTTLKNGFKNLEKDIDRKREFMKKVYANTEVQKIFQTGRISSDQLFKSYTLDKKDDEQLTNTFKDLLGYDPTEVSQQNQDKYEKTIFNITTSTKTDTEKYTMLQDAEKTFKTRQQYPWLSDNQLEALLKKYKDDPQLLDSVVQEMSQERWNNIAYNKSGNFKVDPSITRAIDQLTYQSTKEGDYTNIAANLRETVDSVFSNPEKMKVLFAQWNDKNQGDNDVINTSRAITGALIGGVFGGITNTISSIQRMKNEKQAGWYDKYGNKVSNQVPKAFADWARRTGEYSFTPLKPIDPTLQKITDLQQGLQTTFLGISSNEIADLGASFARKTNYTERTGIIEDGSINIDKSVNFNQDHFYHLLLQNALGSKVVPGYTDFSRMISIK